MILSFIRKFSSFTYLNITQFLGALNDNIYKLLIVYFFIQIEGIENSHTILSITGAIFVMPFLLFSASSGTIADRFSKRNVIILTKVIELIVMILAIPAFYYQSKIGSYTILFFMAAQSTLFGPSKYGIVPELVPTDKISRANGMMTSLTFMAIILGTFFASFLLDITGRNFIIASIFCAGIGLAGLISSLCIQYTPPAGSQKKLNVYFLTDIFNTLKLASQQISLLAAVIGAAFFLFLGAFAQLNMIPFAVQELHLSDIQGGYLFLLTALGIGTGAYIAGRLSGRIVELGLVPLGGVGVFICCYMLDIFSEHLYAVIPLVIGLGLFGGIFEIPLDSYIQVASPPQHRGQVIGATNFLSYLGVLLASILIYVLKEWFNLTPAENFALIGNITIFTTIILGYQFFDYLTRFVAMILSKLHFRVTIFGQENIPDSPAIYVCHHTAWNDALLILGAQRRRLRFFIEQEQTHSKWMRRLYRLLRVVLISGFEPLEKNEMCLTVIRNTLKKGISVCIFVENANISAEIEKLKHSYSFRDILEETHYPIIPVIIDKGIKDKTSRFFRRLMAKIHVPATLTFGEMIKGRPDPHNPSEEYLHDSICSNCQHK